MPHLGKQFGVPYGLSDHTLGTATAVAAVALGASVIEKHFTFDRNEPGPDSAFSLEPAELKSLTCDAYDAWLSLGKVGFEKTPEELQNKKFRRSLYFVRHLKAGDVITQEDVRRIRPGYGLAPKYYDHVIGQTVSVDVSPGEPVSCQSLRGCANVLSQEV